MPIVLLGDLNVLEPDHQPAHRQQFAPFEYDFYRDLTARHRLVDVFRHLHPDRIEHSWARRPELGYRYDHGRTSVDLKHLLTCEYLHETRELQPDGTRLTNHSGLAVSLSLTPTTPLLTSDPVMAASAKAEAEQDPPCSDARSHVRWTARNGQASTRISVECPLLSTPHRRGWEHESCCSTRTTGCC